MPNKTLNFYTGVSLKFSSRSGFDCISNLYLELYQNNVFYSFMTISGRSISLCEVIKL